MHMADALISPAVGGGMWLATAGAIACCSAQVHKTPDDRKTPLMGVLGAFVFAVQMINFTIPATGSSGHLGGGLLLAILLGPSAAFLTIASVLIVQALFFADGGLLALGCNIFNLGLIPTFIAYPLLYKPLLGRQPSQARMVFAAIAAAVVGVQLGSFGVVLETAFSKVISLPFDTFLLLMQPIHLAIGLVEGVVTALVVSFVYRARPEIKASTLLNAPIGKLTVRTMVVAFLVATVLTGGLISWFASEHPDGLEWSIARITGAEELPIPQGKEYQSLAAVQQKTALLPDYALPNGKGTSGMEGENDPRLGTSLSGLVGGLLTLACCLLIGVVLKKRARHEHEPH